MAEVPIVPTTEMLRFATIRPAKKIKKALLDTNFVSFNFFDEIDPTELAAIESSESLLYTLLMAEIGSADPRTAMETVVNTFRTSSSFYYADIDALYAAFRGFEEIQDFLDEKRDTTNPTELEATIDAALGGDGRLHAFITNPAYLGVKLRLWDNLFSAMVIPNNPELRERIIDVIKVLSLMERIDADDTTLADKGTLEAIRANVILPSPLFPLKKIVNEMSVEEEPTIRPDIELEAALGMVKKLQTAREDIGKVFANQQLELKRKTQARAGIESMSREADLTFPNPIAKDGYSPDQTYDLMFLEAARLAEVEPNTKALLADLKVPMDYLYIPFIYERIDAALKLHGDKAQRRTAKERPVVHIGGVLIDTVNLCLDKFQSTPCDPYTGVSLPKGSGHIKPAGVADLLVVQQQLLKYELGEVAHIENVMLTELKDRTHRKLNREEETFTVETESSTETERDTQTTERFGMEKESSSVLQEDQSLQAGVSISASYGGMVTINAGVDYATSSSSITTESMATQYAKSVTDRALERVKERVRTLRTKTTIAEVEETNEHKFDNTDTSAPGASHVVGQYHWVDKFYLNRVMNYGKRLMYEFLIPEPAAFYIYSKTQKPAEGSTVAKPFTPAELGLKSHTDLSVANYGSFIAAYNVSNVAPPPVEYQTVSHAFNQPSTGHGTWGTYSSKDLKVPTGYTAKAAYARVGTDWNQAFMMLQVGRHHLGGQYGNFYSCLLDDETDYVPVSAFLNYNTLAFVNIEVVVKRSPETMEQWQLKTYTAIMEAYNIKQRNYDESVNAMKIAAGVQIEGNNPMRNREIERTELKKGCIELLTDQKFDAFDAMRKNQPSQGYPEFRNIEAKAEGEYIRFFEQAFEWGQMTYVFYPYFWGRKANWTTISLMEDNDPLFTNFLQAGAVRVMVPVRPNFTEAVLHYTESGNIWNGASVPTIDDPLYLDIVTEIKSATGTLEIEPEEVGTPWITKIPTSLVKLAPGTAPALPDNSSTLLVP